jgi:hypothetical protein
MLERRAREASSYHPRLLLGLIVYGYATGVFSGDVPLSVEIRGTDAAV